MPIVLRVRIKIKKPSGYVSVLCFIQQFRHRFAIGTITRQSYKALRIYYLTFRFRFRFGISVSPTGISVVIIFSVCTFLVQAYTEKHKRLDRNSMNVFVEVPISIAKKCFSSVHQSIEITLDGHAGLDSLFMECC